MQSLLEPLLKGDRAALGRAITLIESEKPEHRELACELTEQILPHTGRAKRIGITGVPGAGKSTLIDSLGLYVIQQCNETVAVLTVDPSSPRTGGSILGDKTRMQRLAGEERSFIRPSPSRGHLGGVAARTKEAMLLCEAAGYSTILIETVGVGQSEFAVKDIVDVTVLVLAPGAGDDIQGIKRGIVEIADIIAINKADGEQIELAKTACTFYSGALLVSAQTQQGVPELWNAIQQSSPQRERG